VHIAGAFLWIAGQSRVGHDDVRAVRPAGAAPDGRLRAVEETDSERDVAGIDSRAMGARRMRAPGWSAARGSAGAFERRSRIEYAQQPGACECVGVCADSVTHLDAVLPAQRKCWTGPTNSPIGNLRERDFLL